MWRAPTGLTATPTSEINGRFRRSFLKASIEATPVIQATRPFTLCPTTAHYVAPQRIATAPPAAAAAAAAPPAAAAASHPTAAIDQKKNDGAFRDDLPSFSRPPHVAAQATTVTDGKPMLQLSAMDASRTIAPSSTPQYHPRHITTTATNHVKNEYTTTAYTKTATTFTAITKTKTTTTEMLCQKNMYYMPATAKTPAACKDCPEKSELLKVHHQWECCKCISGYTGYPRCVSTTTAVTATTKTKTTTTKSTTTVTSKTTTSVTTVTATTKTKTTTSKTTVTTTTKTTKTTTKATKTKTTTTTTKTTTKRKPTTTQHVTRAHFKDFKMKGCGECVGAGPSFPALKNGSCPWVKPVANSSVIKQFHPVTGQCVQILKPPNILMKVIPAYFLNASGNDTAHACQAICTGISAVCTGFTLYKNNTKNGINSCKLHGYFKDPVKKWVDNYLAGCKDCFTYTPGVL
eukprot:gene3806-14407_t